MPEANDPKSPHYEWGPSSVGSLHRRLSKSEEILNAHIAEVIQSNPDIVPDEIVRGLIIKGLRGDLKAKRGRKPGHLYKVRNFQILEQYDYLLPVLQERAKRQRKKGHKKPKVDLAPAECACALLGGVDKLVDVSLFG